MINPLQTQPHLYEKPSVVWSALDALFPPFCCNCGLLGYELCPDCKKMIEILDGMNLCPICGDIMPNGIICSDCQTYKPCYDQLKSWGLYSGILREVIQKIKFNRRLGLIRYFTASSVEFIKSWNIDIDHIIPVPLGKSRHHSRGFNQAALIARPISKKLKIPYRPHALTRVKETSSQVGLNSKEREQNVLNAFEGDMDINRNKSVLVIDDITTTGSTLNECAKALGVAGARKVYCFTLARTPFSKNQIEEMEVK